MRVIVNGARGKMGAESVLAIEAAEDMSLVAALGRGDNLAEAITEHHADVVVDMTHPASVFETVSSILRAGAHAVVGTTGLSDAQLNTLDILALEHKKRCIICPNFAIGAVLMMQFAAQAAKYLPHVEIIEYHHNKKVDAPSGTAIKTAQLIAAANPGVNAEGLDEMELIKGARGGSEKNIPIHSLRLPGVIANQDVCFGGEGQSLTLSHKTLSRSSFMPGVLLCIRKTGEGVGLVYGLERVL